MDELSPSEALYGFCSWLIIQDKPITITGSEDSAMLGQLVHRFCIANSLEQPQEGWEKKLVSPNNNNIILA